MAKILINIDVQNLAKAKAFYTQAFDLKPGRRFGDDGLELWGADGHVAFYLLVKEEGSKPFADADETRRYIRHWTPVHLDFVVEDIESAMMKAKAAGGVFKADAKPREAKWGKIVELSDPFGNGICLVEFQGRGYDEISSS